MAGLNVIPVQEAIYDFISTEFSAYEVFEDAVLDDEYLIKQNNKTKPYIVVTHGMPVRSGANTSFGGARLDEYVCSVDVSVVAPTPKQVRKAMNIIHDRLVGWRPTGGGILTPYASGGPWAVLDPGGVPHIYTGSMRFEYPVNSENPGEHITP